MIITTLPIKVYEVKGRDVYAQPVLTPIKGAHKCAPVRLDFDSDTTTVRTDSGASQGHAREDAHKVVILVKPDSPAAKMDRVVEVMGVKLVVRKVHPRLAVTGKLDHYQLGLEPWA